MCCWLWVGLGGLRDGRVYNAPVYGSRGVLLKESSIRQGAEGVGVIQFQCMLAGQRRVMCVSWPLRCAVRAWEHSEISTHTSSQTCAHTQPCSCARIALMLLVGRVILGRVGCGLLG